MDKNRETLVNVINVPKGKWSKQLKFIPSGFCDQKISEHHSSKNSRKHKTKGYRMFKSKRVRNVYLSFEKEKSVTHIKSKVHASYKVGKVYSVHIVLKSDSGNVKIGHCNCKSGMGGVCCHVAATLWFILDCQLEGLAFIRNDLTCTDIAQKWGKCNTKTRKLSTSRFSRLNFVKHNPGKITTRKSRKLCVQKYSSISQDLHSQEDVSSEVKDFANELKALNKRSMWQAVLEERQFIPLKYVPISYESSQPVTIVEDRASLFERVKLPAKLIKVEEQLEYPESLVVSLEDAILIEQNTRDQHQSDLWRAERKPRLTASNFGCIVKRRKKVTDQFVKGICSKDIGNLKYVQEGIRNEPEAVKKYESLFKRKVHTFKVGLVINPGCPVIGCSPDGLVYDEDKNEYGLLEVKTFSKAKDLKLTVAEAINKKDLNTCLKMDKSGTISLKRTHNYYYQVIGQLGISGLDWCDFFVDTGVDVFCERIDFDSDLFLNTILPKLKLFYFEHFCKTDCD